jgi:hypothetical protein
MESEETIELEHLDIKAYKARTKCLPDIPPG